MKKLILVLGLFAISFGLFANTYVQGHYRSNGTYVKGHYRSSPDNTRLNNWSTKGNTNPYTGKVGTKPASPSYNNNIGTIRSNNFGNSLNINSNKRRFGY